MQSVKYLAKKSNYREEQVVLYLVTLRLQKIYLHLMYAALRKANSIKTPLECCQQQFIKLKTSITIASYDEVPTKT